MQTLPKPPNGTSVTAVETPIPARELAVGRPLAVVLGLLTVFGPISMDLYLPVLPALTAELSSTTSVAQLTITACLLGLAIGQVVAGPLSDRLGRRMPLLIGVVAAYTLTSALCALSPTIEALIARPVRPGPGRRRGHRDRAGSGAGRVLRAESCFATTAG